MRTFLVFIVIGGLLALGLYKFRQPPHVTATTNATKTIVTKESKQPNMCAQNTIEQMVLVSVSERHMWACTGSLQSYDSPVITGMEKLATDLTPRGTYKIYSKTTNLYLNGSDSTGSWHDYVYYWMPFLSNKYGVYGFHDATWRSGDAFGNIDPNSDQASHGCVELPLNAATWLYNWVKIGTTVTIQT